MILTLGALLGLISVGFGAFAEHALREAVTDEHFRFLMTAVRYNQVNSAIIVAIGFAALGNGRFANTPMLKPSGVLFIIGTVLFSFSIYLSVSLDFQALLNLTPVGGVTLMGAWASLMLAGIFATRKQ
ncbi:MAG: DUF423 domain-containing protein [Chloroflexota bacterium]